MPYYLCRIAGEDGRVDSRSILAPSAEECRRTFEAEGRLVLSVHRDWNRLANLGYADGTEDQGPGHHPAQPRARRHDQGGLSHPQEPRVHLAPDQERPPEGDPDRRRRRGQKGQGLVRGLPALREAVLPGLYGQPHGRRKGRQPGRVDRSLYPVHEDGQPDEGPDQVGHDLSDDPHHLLLRPHEHPDQLRHSQVRRFLQELRGGACPGSPGSSWASPRP